MAGDRLLGAWFRPCRWEAQDVGRRDRVAMLLPWRHRWPDRAGLIMCPGVWVAAEHIRWV